VTSAPVALEAKLRSALEEMRRVQQSLSEVAEGYRGLDANQLKAEVSDESMSGPEALDAVVMHLGRLDQSVEAAESALRETLVYASGLHSAK
jgi:hypothetical protein